MRLLNKNNPTCREPLRMVVEYVRGASEDASPETWGIFGNLCGALEIYRVR